MAVEEKTKTKLTDLVTPEPVADEEGNNVIDIEPTAPNPPQNPTIEPEPVEKVEAPPKKEKPEDVIDALESKVEPVSVELTYNGSSVTYSQKPLTYFRKMEFFGLLGETIDQAMEGEDGLSVNALFSGPNESLLNAFDSLDSFMALIAKVAHYVPSFLKESYLVILNVPKAERAWAREALDNLDDEAGMQIAERFIDQNMDSIRSFFVERIPALVEKVRGTPKG